MSKKDSYIKKNISIKTCLEYTEIWSSIRSQSVKLTHEILQTPRKNGLRPTKIDFYLRWLRPISIAVELPGLPGPKSTIGPKYHIRIYEVPDNMYNVHTILTRDYKKFSRLGWKKCGLQLTLYLFLPNAGLISISTFWKKLLVGEYRFIFI